jgi:hypothetical protein
MLLAEIREQVVKYGLAKGIITDENSLNYDALDTDIIVGRVAIGKDIISNKGKLGSQWYLTSLIEFDQDIQENTTEVIYNVPDAIGGIYSMILGEDGIENGTIVQNATNYYSNITKQIPSRYRGFVENSVLRVNSPLPQNIKLRAAFVNPFKLVEWNEDYDNFPMDDGHIMDLITLLVSSFYKYVVQTPLDTKSDSAESNLTPNQK